MAVQKYEPIYQAIKKDITSGKYTFGDILLSENQYTEIFSCTRNTVRRALAMLNSEGYVQPIHGKGVQVIYQNKDDNELTITGLESSKEFSLRNNVETEIELKVFRQMIVGNAMHSLTGLPTGNAVYYIETVRHINNVPVCFDTAIYLKSEVPAISRETAGSSIFEYIENHSDFNIATSIRRVTSEKPEDKDVQYLDLSYDDILLVSSDQLFNSKGILFGYCQSRYKADSIVLQETVLR